MALILDETFATGMPANFATARTKTGTLTATYNSGGQAVDLSNLTDAESLWDITSTPLCAAGELEVDLELLSDPANIKHLGLWLVAGTGAVSNGVRIAHLGSVYQYNIWSGSTDWVGGAAAVTTPDAGLLFSVGTRRTFGARWDMGQAGRPANLEVRVDGILLLSVSHAYTSFRSGISLYNASVRVHSIKMWDAPTVALRDASFRGFSTGTGFRSLAPVEATDALGLRNLNRAQVLGARNMYFGGNGSIYGTVKEKNTPANTPLRRKVWLLDERSGQVIRETWSDAATGAYEFRGIKQGTPYTVLAYDRAHNYRAVAGDNLLPDPMP